MYGFAALLSLYTLLHAYVTHCECVHIGAYCYFTEPIPECDVEQWNKDFMQRSEELYDAMMDCHWEPLDSVDSPIPSLS